MKIEKARIGDFEAEFNGMMIHGTVNGVEFSEYLTIKEGAAVVERVDSNIKLNMSTELEQTGLDADDLLDDLEEAAQEAFQSLYVDAYEGAIMALVPDFDNKKDLEVSGSPWCLYEVQYVDAKNVADIIEQAKAHAENHAPEIAKLLADDFENADNMPRIILTDDDKAHHIYDVNNLLDIFGRCENGLDFEAIKEAFNRAPKMMGFDAFEEMAQSFEGNE